MRPSTFLFATLILWTPTPVRAQELTATRWSAPVVDSAPPRPRPGRFTIVSARSGSALVGMVAGVYAGLEVGAYYTPVTERDDWAPSDEQLAGVLIGLVAGTALGAALPSFNSPCSFGRRFRRALGGTLLGFVPAAILGPVGPSVGAALAQGRC